MQIVLLVKTKNDTVREENNRSPEKMQKKKFERLEP